MCKHTSLSLRYLTSPVTGRARRPVCMKSWQTLSGGLLGSFSFLKATEIAAARTSNRRRCRQTTSAALGVSRQPTVLMRNCHEEMGGTKSHNNNHQLYILTCSLWWFCFHHLLRAGGSLTSRAEGGFVARNPIKLAFSFIHVPAISLLFLPRNLFGQAQCQTRPLWMNRLLLLQQAAGLLLQLLEDFFSFFPNETQNKYRVWVCAWLCVFRRREALLTSAGTCWSEHGRYQRRRKQTSDCQQSTTGDIPHSRVLSPGGVSCTGQRRSYSKSPVGYLKPHPGTKNTLMSAQWKRITQVYRVAKAPRTHLTVCDVAAEQFEVLHGLWALPLTEFRWQSKQAELSIRHRHRLHILSTTRTYLQQL